MMSPGGDEASSGSDTVPPFGFAKGDLDADGEACDAPCARCDQIEVGRDADPRDSAAGGDGPFDGAVDDPPGLGLGGGPAGVRPHSPHSAGGPAVRPPG